ncbi:MAG: Ldh family oxidoreductase [Hyphomicrobiales bacterium]|nr:Ldh family oxidoreductase [Hyphomicrobiales bacterium]
MKRLRIAEIEDMARRALIKAGARPEAATSLAKAIAAAERDGIPSHGLAYLPTYCEHLACGKVVGSAVPKLSQEMPGIIVVDAGSGFAHPAIDAGFAALVPLARRQGIALLAIRNSYNCGVLGYHTQRLASEGLLSLGFTNAPASIAASGGRKPVLGTNPWSIAVPDGNGGASIVIDQSASVVAKSEVAKRAREGKSIPLGWTLGPDGEPTTDPNIGLKGTMLPAGGYKGVGSALLVELMAACLTGATIGAKASPFSGTAGGPPKTGQCFVAIAPEGPSHEEFKTRCSELMAALTAEATTHIPGRGRRAARHKAEREGVAVDPNTLEKVSALAGGPAPINGSHLSEKA